MANSKKQAWFFCTTGLPSDIEIEVDDITFHLHKLPLMSKSRKLHQLITEQEQSTEQSEVDPHIKLENFPGGSDIFETVVKISYGFKVDISVSTAVPLRCAAEYLEMTEEYSPENLISKTERFFSQYVFTNVRESIKALKSCEPVSSLTETLGLTKQCIDSIVFKASSTDPSSFLLGWPINNGGIFTVDQKKQSKESKTELWFEDLTEMSFPIFRRVILALKSRGLSDEIIEKSLISYVKKHIPGISRSSYSSSSTSATTTIASENEQRELLETIISDLLPLNNSSIPTSTTRSLFGILRSAIILNTSENCRALLEKKIGTDLEKATLDDLLIPSYSYLNDTLYDIDLVERLLRRYLEKDAVSSPLKVVGKLMDGVLGEIASDGNLKPEKFYNLAVLVPVQARVYDDGLYRAVDMYFKAHPWISEAEKEKICSVMDCRKLTVEGCTHAAQNERLPLRAVVQVLFLEQLQLRQVITGTLLMTEEEEGEVVEFGRWKKTVKENEMLRLDMDTMRTRVNQLEREYSHLKKVIIGEMNKESSSEEKNDRERKWSLGKRLGCKFTTQVCDSHEATLVDRRSRRRSLS
ncbi:PREDICTED: BTB/POZ domain-containing protein At3g50840-like [Camelina sativa]|uniref:BTB/POZ domain-containing protein At3g50840-like n=1 Tax=Camelina sativa TaxID=90675 RepID=A0ABM0YNU9_CAMSA|nr:PREDICTED: BTB/POZ domain-containing protein At3g50840-like [Camelina sativa]